MARQVIANYLFNPSAGTLTLPDFDSIDLERLAIVTNVTDGVLLFVFSDPTRRASVSGNIITFIDVNTTTMSSTDDIRIDYDVPYGEKIYDRTVVGNARTKFRDGFTGAVNTAFTGGSDWTITNTHPADHLLLYGGNAAGSSYVDISLSPLVEGEVSITSSKSFEMPIRVGYGISLSQRIPLNETFFGLVGCDNAGTVETTSAIADKSITGTTISLSGNVATVTLNDHGYQGGDRVAILNCPEARLNTSPVAITVVDRNTFTYPLTLSAGTYNCTGGIVRWLDPTQYASNAIGYLTENTTTTNASFIARRAGEKFRTSGASTIASTTPTQTNTSPYTDAWNASAIQELFVGFDEVAFRSYTADSNGSPSSYFKYSQSIPEETKKYKMRIYARNWPGQPKVVGRITSISKSGTTTATVTTDIPHNLTTSHYVLLYGMRDQTNFPNVTTASIVLSTPTSTTFTVAVGTAATATSAGGFVILQQGNNTSMGQVNFAIQSVSRTSNVMTVIGNGTWSGFSPGDYIQIHGMDGSAATYDGAYKVLRLSSTTLEVASTGSDFISINCGGGVIRRTDFRLHFIRLMDHTRMAVEVYGGRGNVSDQNNAVPVSVVGTASITNGALIGIYNGGSSTAVAGGTPATHFANTSWNINDSRQTQREMLQMAAERVQRDRWTF